MAVTVGTAVPTGTSVIVGGGIDTNNNAQYDLLDPSGRTIVVGPGVSGTAAGGILTIQGIASGGAVPVVVAPSVTTNNTSVAGVTGSVQLIAANSNRLGVTIYNDSFANLYMLMGSGPATVTAYTVLMIPAAYFETPFNYNGAIQGIWAIATGFARVTEAIL